MKTLTKTPGSLAKWLTYSFMIASYIPFLVFSKLPAATTDSVLTYASRQAGYAAAILLIWQFILGTRSLTKFWIRDQVWVIRQHKNIGIYSIALILSHPILIAFDYNRFGILTDVGVGTSFERNVLLGKVALLLFVFIWVTSAILRSKIGFRPWKYIHYLTYLIMPLVLLHAPKIGTFYAGRTYIRYSWTALIAVFAVIVLARLAKLFTFGDAQYKLIAKKELATNTFLYKLEPLGKNWVKPDPGQFLYIRSNTFGEEHPFSVASYSKNSGEISIIVKKLGKYTNKLPNTKIGETVYLDGPYGVFTKEVTGDMPVTFIAGGIGVTPFIQHILNQKNSDLTLFNANRDKSYAVLDSVMVKKLGINYIPVYSQNAPAGAESGYVTVELLKKYLGDQFDKQYYFICGPPIMMKLVKQSLADAGIDGHKIHTEEFSY